MIELRFHKELYSAEALDRAAAAYEAFARVERADEAGYFVTRLTALPSEGDESETAAEFANYVLGATVDGRKPEGQGP